MDIFQATAIFLTLRFGERTVDWGYPFRFEGTLAKTQPNGDLASLSAKRSNGNGTYGMGIHHFGENDWGDKERTIHELYYTYAFNDKISANLMYLGSDLNDPQGRKNGFIFKVQDGRVNHGDQERMNGICGIIISRKGRIWPIQ